MTSHQPLNPPVYMRTLEQMTAIKEAVRGSAQFQNVMSECQSDYVQGGESATHSECMSSWTLYGSNGMLRVTLSYANDSERTLVTCVTYKRESGSQGAEVVLSGNGERANTVENVVRKVSDWLSLIAKPTSEPFLGVSLPGTV